MIVTYKTIPKIKFPVYVLPSENWENLDGLLFVDGELVDDKNMPGSTLGIRRLQTPYREIMPLKKAAKNFIALTKSRKRFFIDSKGLPFIYERTVWTVVKYHRIQKIDRKKVAAIISVQGIRNKFTVPRPPPMEMLWVGVLYLHGIPWLLYEYSVDKKPDTRRKI
jgi:hypothetical protein